MHDENITPGIGERASIVGKTGSGKTVLAIQFIRAHQLAGRRVVVHDSKRNMHTKGLGDFARYETLSDLMQSDSPTIIYAPTVYEQRDEATREAFFEWVFTQGNITLYVDEVYSVVYKQDIPFYYHAIFTQGREFGITCISSTQRPKDIPQVLLSEAERLYIFRLTLAQDRKKVKEISGIEDKFILPPKEFLYSTETSPKLRRITVRLPLQSQ